MDAASVMGAYAQAWSDGDPERAWTLAMFVRERVVRGDEQLELERVNLYRVVDDKIVSIDIFEANQYEVDAFFG